jgi:hypothetical protein
VEEYRDKLEELRTATPFKVACQLLMVTVCGYGTWRSIRLAAADWLASEGTLQGFERAARFAPDDERLLARDALYRNDNEDPSPVVDEELRRASRIDPLDSAVWMTLGLREEFRGNAAEAEKDLVRAAEVDHQFKPAWTLANYYYRVNQPEKGWPMIQRILNLDPLGFDPGPVFELCWREIDADANPEGHRQVEDSRKIVRSIPKRGQRPVAYLDFLIRTRRIDAALDMWPMALDAAAGSDSQRNDAYAKTVLIGFADALMETERIPEAVMVWNQLVERGFIHSGSLDPSKGISVADPDFMFPPLSAAFGWRLGDVPGVFGSGFAGSLRFEITGDQPQSSRLLSVFAPVLPNTRYRLAWKADGSELSSPTDPGFDFQIAQQAGELIAPCPALLGPRNADGCSFLALPGSRRIRIDLVYARVAGTTRASGVLLLLNTHLEIARE